MRAVTCIEDSLPSFHWSVNISGKQQISTKDEAFFPVLHAGDLINGPIYPRFRGNLIIIIHLIANNEDSAPKRETLGSESGSFDRPQLWQRGEGVL